MNDPPAHISVVDGAAILERDGRTDTDLASMPLLAGDRLRTQGGRVEVLFADGSALHLDANTVVDFQSDEVVRLLEGRVRLSVAGPARDLSYRIDAPSAWVQISTPGEYRVASCASDEVELAVLRGSAELVNEQGRSYISRRRTHVRPRRHRPVARLRLQLGRVGCLRSVVGGAPRSAARRLGAVPAGRRAALRAGVRRLRQLALRAGLRLRLVPARRRSAGGRIIAAAGSACARTAGPGLPAIPGAGRPITTAAGASRRARGSGFPGRTLGAGVGVLGLRARLRQLVPARLEQSPDLRAQRERLRRPPLRPVGRVDGAAAPSLQRRLRQRLAVRRRSASIRDSTARFVAEQRGPDGHFAVNRPAIPIRSVGRYSAYRSDPGRRCTRSVGGGPHGATRRRRSRVAAAATRHASGRRLRPVGGRSRRRRARRLDAAHRWDTRATGIAGRAGTRLAPASVGVAARRIAATTAAPAAFAARTPTPRDRRPRRPTARVASRSRARRGVGNGPDRVIDRQGRDPAAARRRRRPVTRRRQSPASPAAVAARRTRPAPAAPRVSRSVPRPAAEPIGATRRSRPEAPRSAPSAQHRPAIAPHPLVPRRRPSGRAPRRRRTAAAGGERAARRRAAAGAAAARGAVVGEAGRPVRRTEPSAVDCGARTAR